MFTTPAPAPPALSTSSSQTSTTTPSRPSGRLRGLSYLRNYTHTTLHTLSAGSSFSDVPSRADRSRTPRAPPTATIANSARQRSRSRTSDTGQSVVPPALPPQQSGGRTTPSPDLPDSNSSLPSNNPSSADPIMTRVRAEPAAPQLTVRNHSGPTPASTPSSMDNAVAEAGSSDPSSVRHLPSIRLIPHQDPRATRPSLQFPTITRTLPDETCVIRVGRYSERDNIPEVPANVPSAAAVGFKSKVVSRKHCELWCSNSQWYIKDVKSSSGTFLNHIRLSQPNVESKPFKVKDGDIVQLGIDFRGGEEMIFRCVKIRIECNRGWQQGLNTFNKQTHQRLKNLAKSKKDSDSASNYGSECSICLMSIAPCQSLFVAPCSHVWHYKCIRPILNSPQWPNFLCPNCRAVTDLEADVDEPTDWDVELENLDAPAEASDNPESQEDGDRQLTPRASAMALLDAAPERDNNDALDMTGLEAAISSMRVLDTMNAPSTPQRQTSPAASSSVTQPVSINITSANEVGVSPLFRMASDGLSPERAVEGPMTPRNDAGPFVLDGSGGTSRTPARRSADGNSPSPANSGTGAPVLPPLQMD